MTVTEYAVAAFFIAVVLFGLIDAIRTPLIVKRFYKDKKFTDKGRQSLEALSGARILDGMYTEHQNTSIQGDICQFKAWSNHRRKFTLSKAARKRNRTAWSVTIVEGDFSNVSCLILPTVVPEAIAYIGNSEDIDFGDDQDIANRYHVTTEKAELLRSTITGDIREFLLLRDVVFIEVTDSQLVMKRNWTSEKVLDRLEQELEIAAEMKKFLEAGVAQS